MHMARLIGALNTRSLPELFRMVGLSFPYADQAVEEAIQFVFSQFYVKFDT